MKQLFAAAILLLSLSAKGQTVLFSENFNTGGPGWTLNVVTGPEGTDPNFFQVDDDEGGGITPNLGAPGSCGAANNGDMTLHVTSVFNPAGGAAYDAGGLCGILFCPQANRRSESPTINCSGQSTVSVSFNYIEGGHLTNDDATLWYFDGVTWTMIDNMPKTLTGCGGQGLWTSRTVALPASANNNANVKIAFGWVNNDDGVGADPSFAVDNVEVTVPATSAPTAAFTASSTSVCTGQPVNFTDNSTGAPTGWSWTFPGGTPPTSTSQNVTGVTWAAAGTYTVTLTASNANGTNSTTQVITVTATPTVTATAANTVICQGQSVTLNTSGATSYNWMPGSLSGSSVSVTPASTTTYTVTGTSGTCTDTAQITITVQVCAPPAAAFTASSTNVCTGDPVNFTDNSTGGPTAWTWTFPSGTPGTSSAQNVTGVTWAVAGTYTVTLQVSNTNGSNSTTQVITVTATPTVTATAANTVICTGQSVTLNTSGATSYTWMPGSLSGSSVSVTPASTTTYTVTGTDGTCSDTAQITITVQACSPPTAAFTASSTNVCVGQPVNFTDNSTGGPTSWTWTFPGGTPGTSGTQNVTGVVWNAAGTYTVTLDVSNVNGNNTTTQVITVNALPNVTATSGSSSICPGGSATMTASGATSYTWLPGGQTTNPLVVTPATTTSYTVTGIDANGCPDTAQVTITVNTAPPVNATALNATICVGQSTTLTAGGASSFAWQPGSLTGISVTVSPAATTTYTVTGTDANGCTGTAQVIVIVQACSIPTAVATVSDNSICEGNCIDFTDNSTGTPTSWTWTFPGGSPASSTQQNPSSICFATAGTYTVQLIAGNISGNDTTTIVVTVGAPANIDAGPYTQIAIGNSTNLSASGGSGSYSWSPPTGLSCTTCASPTASPTVTTTYTVTMTDGNGCQSTDTVTVEVIEKYDLFVPSAFSPNGDGVNEILFVRGAGIRSLEFVVFSRIGEKVFETTDKNIGWDGTFRGAPMNTAVFTYYVRAEFYNNTTAEKKGDITLVR
ncbi:MAG: psrP1 [Bacteroidetes bacterium]|nr:MAG: psrP1 [Bacteroidota bacterium]